MMLMARTTVDIDGQALDAAQRALGTRGLSRTVNAALRRVANERSLASFDVVRDIDGTPEQVEANRLERFPGPRG